MTLLLSSIESVRTAINLFEEFNRYSGLKLNKAKTEAFLIEGENIKLCATNTIGIGGGGGGGGVGHQNLSRL